jgi:heme-degrading monooxygenase HmoA
MFLALWEYEVKPGCEERFENAYGPAGDWAKLFRSDSKYRETRLLRDPFRSAIYLTLDFWNSRVDYEQFAHKDDYRALDAAGEELTSKERRIGGYELAGP